MNDSVSVPPNSSMVKGRVLSANPYSNGWILDFFVNAASDVDGKANFVKPHEGQTIQVFAHQRLYVVLPMDSEIELQIGYAGSRFVLQQKPTL